MILFMDTKALAEWLYAQPPGVMMKLVADITDDWEPTLGKCHDNVDVWLERHPDHRAVRGWIWFSAGVPENRRRYASHSAVINSDGELLDVTYPSEFSWVRFIPHPWDPDEFREAVRDNGLPTVDYRLGPDVPIVMDPPTEEEWPPRQF
jgi:hypothetical protein